MQVSTDGGKTYQSLATEDTTSEHDPDAVAGAVENLPGLTGDSETWKTEHADLTPYAGKTILLGFRYITDGGVDEGGFWVRNIDAAGTTLPTTLDGWQTISQANPTPVVRLHGAADRLRRQGQVLDLPDAAEQLVRAARSRVPA